MTEKTKTITYTFGTRYQAGSCYQIEPYGTLTRTCEIEEGEDWKEVAQKLQQEVYSILGDTEYLKNLKSGISECEDILRRYDRVLKKASTKYNEMKQFMVAQGLGDKMPNEPSLFLQTDKLIKSLQPSVDVEVVEDEDDDDEDYEDYD